MATPRKIIDTVTRPPLAIKLWLAIFAAATVVIFISLVLTRVSLERGFKQYIEQRASTQVSIVLPKLEAFFTEHQSWREFEDNRRLWKIMEVRSWHAAAENSDFSLLQNPGSSPNRSDPTRRGPIHPMVGDLLLADPQKRIIAGRRKPETSAISWRPIIVAGVTEGYLGYTSPTELRAPNEVEFLRQQTRGYAVVGILSLVVSGLFAIPLAMALVKPIRQLQRSTLALAQGDLTTRVTHRGGDELGQLAQQFNHLAATLEANEQSRRRLVMDTSHELRTPVTFLKGQIEALIDGVRPANTENLSALSDQINHLSKMIDDLYQLSTARLGGLNFKKSWQPIGAIIERAVAAAQPAMAEHELICTLDNQVSSSTELFVDQDRLLQLLDNLLMNSLKYTHAPGRVVVTATQAAEKVTVVIADTAPGVDEAHLPNLFDEFYRTDQSRNSKTGGTGIGLAICRNIAQAHNGSISTNPSKYGGLAITLSLPTASGRHDHD